VPLSFPPAPLGSYSQSSQPANTPLKSVQEVIQNNEKLIEHKKWGNLCQLIAREAIFGPELMANCTPSGGGITGKALPADGMSRLKNEIFML